MRKLYQWVFAAILTICGTMTQVSCSSFADNPTEPTKPVESPDRAVFQEQLSATLDQAVKYQNLETTLQAAEVLTEFVEHLNIDALAPQFGKIMGDIMGGTKPITADKLSEQDAADALTALKNTYSGADKLEFLQVEASKVLNGLQLTFVEGQKEMSYEKVESDGLVIAYKNPAANEGIEVKFQFQAVDDGVTMFITRVANSLPVAIQLPQTIKFTINRTHAGASGDVMEGIVMLSSPQKKKYISLKNCEWELGVATNAATADRYELPMAIMHHYADGKVDGQIALAINDVTVLAATVNSTGIPYSDEEMENLKELREKGLVFAGFYEVLNMFNSRSGKAQLVVMGDLEFNIEVRDIAKAVSAFGTSRQYQGQQPAKEVIEPLTADLNSALSFTVKQRSTGITAEGTMLTAEINGRYKPALALRFDGETEFQVMNENLSDKDRANYNSLMSSFEPPINQLQKLLNALNKKRQEFKEVSPFK